MYVYSCNLLRGIVFFYMTDIPTLHGFWADAHRFTLVSGWFTNQSTHHLTHPTHQLTPIYLYPPRNPHARFSVPTCISLKRERSQDICWNTFKIEEPPTQQPNALKSVDRVSASCRALPSHEDFIFWQGVIRRVVGTEKYNSHGMRSARIRQAPNCNSYCVGESSFLAMCSRNA